MTFKKNATKESTASAPTIKPVMMFLRSRCLSCSVEFNFAPLTLPT